MKRISLLLILMSLTITAQQEPDKIAFVADIHLLDIYADYENFDGIEIDGKHQKAKIRSMSAQLHSTRLFNENYFVLKAVLDDIAARGIKLVAFPGDYTDDGQPININGLAEILKTYKDQYDISFFITTGNHDPVRPYNISAGKNDFLAKDGRNQPIYSEVGLYREKSNEHKVLIEPRLEKAGYNFILNALADFGFFPQQKYRYWETPFSNYNTNNYTFQKAHKAAKISNRRYSVNDSLSIPDASYLVEPKEGLWLLAIDGNSYVPQKDGNLSSASIGYNQTIAHKKHLFKWIKTVAERAKKLNKRLVAFSHYPAIDFNENASPELEKFLGKNKWQLERVPQEHIAETLAEAGIKLHFAGHMHINDTGKRIYNNKDFLVNIQTPSLAAYIPGYKILNLDKDFAEIETVSINEVPGFDELFPLYKLEYEYLKNSNREIWNIDILNSKNYHDFTEYHLENLVKLRFLPNDWDTDFKTYLSNLTSSDLLKNVSTSSKLSQNFSEWKGYDMILDFYKIRNADKLAFQDIPEQRLKEYKTIIAEAKAGKISENKIDKRLLQFLSIFDKFINGLPANHFKIDLHNGDIQELE
ncbi:metallophosphoesterase family protein [Zunongwangia sp. HRR-M8]|uniref:metallophosphoesterase family protein n=1 Tax=Zunongwangia sp. HRR-M8 TaxID=3015170 RepID=UPI0022DD81F0|nr:metallophosphoesterase [Zunongwangia sp. HRR-M8]WBL21079.1 metallophosphoesterase [Zunongwangia sp. HRR-M8]